MWTRKDSVASPTSETKQYLHKNKRTIRYLRTVQCIHCCASLANYLLTNSPIRAKCQKMAEASSKSIKNTLCFIPQQIGLYLSDDEVPEDFIARWSTLFSEPSLRNSMHFWRILGFGTCWVGQQVEPFHKHETIVNPHIHFQNWASLFSIGDQL